MVDSDATGRRSVDPAGVHEEDEDDEVPGRRCSDDGIAASRGSSCSAGT